MKLLLQYLMGMVQHSKHCSSFVLNLQWIYNPLYCCSKIHTRNCLLKLRFVFGGMCFDGNP